MGCFYLPCQVFPGDPSSLPSQGRAIENGGGTQVMSGGEDTCLHITSLLTSTDPWAAEQLCQCFT